MINEGNLSALLPLLIFMGFLVAIGFWVRRQNAGKNFVQSYFIGNHDLGGHGPALKYPANAYRAALAANGITILDDECVCVCGAFALCGRRDAWMARTSGSSGKKSMVTRPPTELAI